MGRAVNLMYVHIVTFLSSRPCLNLLYYAIPAIPGNVHVTTMVQRKLYYAHIMLNYVMEFYLRPKGWAKPLVVNWQIMAACTAISCSFWTTINGYLKGANEVNRQYFQQAVLLCLLKALYYVGICSYAACIILCPKLCWHNSPRPTQFY